MLRLTSFLVSFLFIANAWADPVLVRRTLRFVSGEDRACSRNCLHVSVNNGPFQKIGCNKRALGNCFSPGGIQGSVDFFDYPGRCNQVRLRVYSEGKDGGVVHQSLNSNHAGLIADLNYHVNHRTPSFVDMWLNDNSDADYYDFRVKLQTTPDVHFGIDRFEGAACP